MSETHSLRPLWQPPFISKIAAEDRCHLNGLAMKDGAPAYVTAVAATDVADGWRDKRDRRRRRHRRRQRRDGGIRPLHAAFAAAARRRALWLLDSGTGHFGRVDLARGRFEPIAFCPGYLRGPRLRRSLRGGRPVAPAAGTRGRSRD